MSPGSRATVLAVALALATTACAPARRSAEPKGISPTLAPLVFYEEGKLVFVAVNAHLARFRLDEELIPLEIAIANKSLPKLTVSAEGITLRDREGGAWPAAAPEESVGTSLRSEFDRKTQPVPFLDLVRLYLPSYRYEPSTFALRRGNFTMSRTAEMSRLTWTYAQIWFPNPGGELKGKAFEVWLDAPELPDPVFTTIRF